MIGIIVLPFYIIFNLFLNKIIMNWLGLFTKIKNKYILLSLQMFLTLSLYIAFILPNGLLKRILTIVGNYYLGIMIYTSIILVLLLLLKFIIKKIKVNRITYTIVGFISILLISFITIYGTINSDIIHTTRYEVDINKKCSIENLNIVMIADLHLGYNKGLKMIKNMVKKINKENPDILIIAGDIFDNNYDSLDKPKEMIKELKKIRTKYGVYAVYGNHDVKEKILLGFTFKDKKKKNSDIRMDKFLSDANIKILKDDYINLDNSIYIYGRPDYKKSINRKKVSEVIKKLDKENPIIVIDHQPKELKELARAGVDLDLSGHTHDGQIFPLNYLIKLAFDNSYGIKKYADMTSIVTSGVGLYGPNLRVLTKAEITSIKVNFKSKQ